MQELIAVIATWISINYGLPPYEAPPAVAFASAAEMGELRSERVSQHAPDPDAIDGTRIVHNGSQHEVHALYDSVTETIYLPKGWSAASPADVSILVHELVHHMQHETDTFFSCPQEREKLAYRAQARWLDHTDDTLEQAFGIDPMTILVRSNCMY